MFGVARNGFVVFSYTVAPGRILILGVSSIMAYLAASTARVSHQFVGVQTIYGSGGGRACGFALVFVGFKYYLAAHSLFGFQRKCGSGRNVILVFILGLALVARWMWVHSSFGSQPVPPALVCSRIHCSEFNTGMACGLVLWGRTLMLVFRCLVARGRSYFLGFTNSMAAHFYYGC